MLLSALLAATIAAPVPKAKANYYPLGVGHTWVYDQGGQEVTEEVVELTAEGGGTRAVTRVTARSAGGWETEHVVKGGAVYQTRGGGDAFDPPPRVLDLALKAGARWEAAWPLTPGIQGLAGEMAAGEAEEVELPAGTFRAVPVVLTAGEVNGKRVAKPRVYTYWCADGVGLVKLKFDRGGKVLKAFTPGTDAKK